VNGLKVSMWVWRGSVSVWRSSIGCDVASRVWRSSVDSSGKKSEPGTVRKFLEGLEVSEDDLSQFGDPDEMKTKLAAIFATKTQVSSCTPYLPSFKI
jgi:hypothetical protein